ncbi:MAG: hypothetical protein LBQ05_01890 [Christensenellaceae bacterium]|jgi:predicted small secreted protein|nr:hypothetical protein [Christensenellaceae bacterium]
MKKFYLSFAILFVVALSVVLSACGTGTGGTSIYRAGFNKEYSVRIVYTDSEGTTRVLIQPEKNDVFVYYRKDASGIRAYANNKGTYYDAVNDDNDNPTALTVAQFNAGEFYWDDWYATNNSITQLIAQRAALLAAIEFDTVKQNLTDDGFTYVKSEEPFVINDKNYNEYVFTKDNVVQTLHVTADGWIVESRTTTDGEQTSSFNVTIDATITAFPANIVLPTDE